jgi:hypothetical protein
LPSITGKNILVVVNFKIACIEEEKLRMPPEKERESQEGIKGNCPGWSM